MKYLIISILRHIEIYFHLEYLRKVNKNKPVRCKNCEYLQKLGVCYDVFCEFLIKENKFLIQNGEKVEEKIKV